MTCPRITRLRVPVLFGLYLLLEYLHAYHTTKFIRPTKAYEWRVSRAANSFWTVQRLHLCGFYQALAGSIALYLSSVGHLAVFAPFMDFLRNQRRKAEQERKYVENVSNVVSTICSFSNHPFFYLKNARDVLLSLNQELMLSCSY